MEETIQILDDLIKKYRMFSTNVQIVDFIEKVEELKEDADKNKFNYGTK